MKCTKCNSNDAFSKLTNLKRHQSRKTCMDNRMVVPAATPAAPVQRQPKLTPTKSEAKSASWKQTTSLWKFQHPATIMVSGPTGSGKTTTFVELINRGMFDPLPKHIFVFHGEEQEIYKEFPKETRFIKGWSDEEVEKLPNDSLVLIDDLMTEVKDCKLMSKLYTKMSHHRRITVVWLTQNLFPRGRECRDISLNSQYILLFPNPRDQAQVCFVSMCNF